MDKDTAREGFDALDHLAGLEYHEDLSEVLSDPDPKRAAMRLGRLVGVLIKTPMATSVEMPEPSHLSSAYRAWELLPQEEFDAISEAGPWQFELLDRVRIELSQEDSWLEGMTTYQLAAYAQTETGFFGLFARALRKYICNDKAVRKQVEDAFKHIPKSAGRVKAPTPEAVVGAGGLSLGVFLVQHVPLLGMVGAPVIAGVVLVIYVLGVHAFCEMAEVAKTNEEERS